VSEPILSIRNLTKRFGGLTAVRGVSWDVNPGEVVALLGDNGAGKSTLIKCVSGVHHADGGEIVFNGKPVHFATPNDARKAGIETIYQDLALANNLDIVQNMFLGREESKYKILSEIKMELATKQTLKDLSVTTVQSVRQLVGSLSGGQRQAVAVARAVMRDSKLVIMDEPTAALGVSQTKLVLELIRTLAARGISVLVISHNLLDVFSVADRIAVMYLGSIVSEGPIVNYDTTSAVELITTGESGRVPSRLSTSL
jgi:ABC-type sugar transport system ATPase subunit